MENVSELTNVVAIIFGVLSLILFIKIWIMTDDIRELKYQVRKILNNVRRIRGHSYYEYGLDTSYEAFDNDIEEIKELIFCEQFDEAKYRLKKLMYNFNKAKKADEEASYGGDSEMMGRMEEAIADLLNVLENKLPKRIE